MARIKLAESHTIMSNHDEQIKRIFAWTERNENRKKIQQQKEQKYSIQSMTKEQMILGKELGKSLLVLSSSSSSSTTTTYVTPNINRYIGDSIFTIMTTGSEKQPRFGMELSASSSSVARFSTPLEPRQLLYPSPIE